jgi:hypothetical protein
MDAPETNPPAPPAAPVEHQGVDRGDWSRVRIPGGQQGPPRPRPPRPEPRPDSAGTGDLDAADDFDAYDQTTSG